MVLWEFQLETIEMLVASSIKQVIIIWCFAVYIEVGFKVERAI